MIYLHTSAFHGFEETKMKAQHGVREFNLRFSNNTIMSLISKHCNLAVCQFSSEISLANIH